MDVIDFIEGLASTGMFAEEKEQEDVKEDA
jgi:hypothetical protein